MYVKFGFLYLILTRHTFTLWLTCLPQESPLQSPQLHFRLGNPGAWGTLC
jgi:hypothetical protein